MLSRVLTSLLLLATSVGPAASVDLAAESPTAGGAAVLLTDTRSELAKGEALHEIIMILVEKGEYDKIPGESKKLLALELPDEMEELKVKSLAIIVRSLSEKKQHDTAHEIIEQALKAIKLKKNQAALLRLQGHLFKEQGNLARALELFRRAIELEKE